MEINNLHEAMVKMAEQLLLLGRINETEYQMIMEYVKKAEKDEKRANFMEQMYDALANRC